MPFPSRQRAADSDGRGHSCQKASAEFLQRGAARDGLGHAFCEFIELIVHTFPFVMTFSFRLLFAARRRKTISPRGNSGEPVLDVP